MVALPASPRGEQGQDDGGCDRDGIRPGRQDADGMDGSGQREGEPEGADGDFGGEQGGGDQNFQSFPSARSPVLWITWTHLSSQSSIME